MGESETDGAEDLVKLNFNLQAGLQFKGPSISSLPPRYHQVYKYFKNANSTAADRYVPSDCYRVIPPRCEVVVFYSFYFSAIEIFWLCRWANKVHLEGCLIRKLFLWRVGLDDP